MCALSVPLLAVGGVRGQKGAPDPQTDAIRATVAKAVQWIGRQARPVKGHDDAVTFPSVAEVPTQRTAIVYGGGAGVLIFLENAAKVLDSKAARELADRTYRGLSHQKRDGEHGPTWAQRGMSEGSAGLYTGDAGVGHAFLVRHRLRKDPEALRAAVVVGDTLLKRSDTEMVGEQRVRWWDEQVEVIFGASGVALFLLELAEATGFAQYRTAAQEVGHWLIQESELLESAPQRRMWRWQAGGNRAYVGFSHGTAGVAYALLRIGVACEDAVCTAAAKDGAEWLIHLTKKDGEQSSWPVVQGMEMSMGGWCHGPPGTARLFLLLHGATKEKRYLDIVKASTRWVMAQAGPEDAAVPPSFPPSFCCGVAGALDYFCDLHRATGVDAYRKFALRAAGHLVATAEADGEGVKWANGQNAHGRGQKQHGIDLMTGASGEAFALLRVLTLGEKVDPVQGLPDRAVK